MRAAALILLVACARPLPPPAPPPPPASEADVRAALVASAGAYEKGDWTGFLDGSQKASTLSPENPDLRYRVARALVKAGKPAEGIALLDRLARQRLAYRAAEHPDFASVKDDPAFKRVIALMAGALEPVMLGDDSAVLPDRELLVESVAHDAKTGAVYISSIHRRTVTRLSPTTGQLVAPADDIWGCMGMAVDAERRVLWVGTAALPPMDGYRADLDGRSAVLRVNLDSGAVEKRYELPGPHVFGDLAVDAKGRVWVSDSKGGGVYRVEGDALVPVVPPGRLRSPQGITFTADGRHAYVADYALGLYSIDTASGALAAVPHADTVAVYGIDGLLMYRGNLLALQNGIRPHRLVRLRLDGARVAAAEVLEMNEHLLEPTSGFLDGDKLTYVATSQWHNFDEAGKLGPEAETTPAILRRVTLP